MGMQLKLYVVFRHGNPDGEDGVDDWDTTLLVRAASVSNAAAIADELLATLPLTSPNCRKPVQPFCHAIQELGIDVGSDQMPGVVIHPFINKGMMGVGMKNGYRFWVREDFNDEWEDIIEAYGEEFFKS